MKATGKWVTALKQDELTAARAVRTPSRTIGAVDFYQLLRIMILLVVGGLLMVRSGHWACRLAGSPYGEDLLFAEAGEGNVAGIDRALSQGAMVNATDRVGSTPLIEAVASGNAMSVLRLLQAGADVSYVTGYGTTALITAAAGGERDIVRILLEHGADPNECAGAFGTSLFQAVLFNHPDVVHLLLCNGADPTIATPHGTTPLDLSDRSRTDPQARQSLCAGEL